MKGIREVRQRIAIVVVFILTACGGASVTSSSSITGHFNLIAVDGANLPISTGGSVLSVGSLDITSSGVVTVMDTRTTSPQGGLPGTSISATGTYHLRALGDKYALDPDASNGPALVVDTLIAVSPDQVVVRRSPRVAGSSVAQWQYGR